LDLAEGPPSRLGLKNDRVEQVGMGGCPTVLKQPPFEDAQGVVIWRRVSNPQANEGFGR
jgi:hypothetical protein